MRFFSLPGSWRSLAAGLLLALGSRPAAAQLLAPATARSYEFMTVTVLESTLKSTAKLLLAPAFNGRSEIQLETLNAFLVTTRLEHLRRNDEILAQSLGELSAAGWELVQVAPASSVFDKDLVVTRYLLRKAKS